jgi:hypothetical protein
MRAAAPCAFSSSSMNGTRNVSKATSSNWVSSEWPIVSAVIPVPSDR